jgi:hypothetical protein
MADLAADAQADATAAPAGVTSYLTAPLDALQALVEQARGVVTDQASTAELDAAIAALKAKVIGKSGSVEEMQAELMKQVCPLFLPPSALPTAALPPLSSC